MATRPTNTAPAVSVEVEHCAHGAPKEEHRAAAVHGYIERHNKMSIEFYTKCQQNGTELGDYKEEMSNASFAILEQFWSEPKHSRLIDAKQVRLCFSYATESVLKGDMAFPRRIAFLGVYLATWFKLGKDTFLGALRGGLPLETSTQQIMADFKTSIGKMGTDRGMVLFLSKQIPCSCLDEDEKKAKQAAKTRKCFYCNSESLELELMKCSQCKSAHYCSKKCQVADWKAGHKKNCETNKRQRERHAMVKAQTHDKER
jgi:hypothetical protein